MSTIYTTIVVEGTDKAAQKNLINRIDAILLKHKDEVPELEHALQFKNVRTRERKPKLSNLETVELDSNGEEEAPAGDK